MIWGVLSLLEPTSKSGARDHRKLVDSVRMAYCGACKGNSMRTPARGVAFAHWATRRYGIPAQGMNGGHVQGGTADGVTSIIGRLHKCAVEF